MVTLLRSLLSAHVALLFVAFATGVMVFLTRMLSLLNTGGLNFAALPPVLAGIAVATAVVVGRMYLMLDRADKVYRIEIWKPSIATTGWRYAVVLALDFVTWVCSAVLVGYVIGVVISGPDAAPENFSELLLLWAVKLLFASVAPWLMHVVLWFSNYFKRCAGL